MFQIRFIAFIGIAFLLSCSGRTDNSLEVINSTSFSEKQITLENSVMQRLSSDLQAPDPRENIHEQNILDEKMNKMISATENVRKTKSDSAWKVLSANWEDFRKNHVGTDGMPFVSDSIAKPESTRIARKWAELNDRLLKLSGEVRFGDALEKILYESKVPVLAEKFLKSAIYTHIDDQIFINVFGSSILIHHHTTGGTIKLIQETNYPASHELTLKCECNDVRYLNVFIRIPLWATNPTVTHGNVKYIPHPGEYCQISRMWRDGDEIRVTLKN